MSKLLEKHIRARLPRAFFDGSDVEEEMCQTEQQETDDETACFIYVRVAGEACSRVSLGKFF